MPNKPDIANSKPFHYLCVVLMYGVQSIPLNIAIIIAIAFVHAYFVKYIAPDFGSFSGLIVSVVSMLFTLMISPRLLAIFIPDIRKDMIKKMGWGK